MKSSGFTLIELMIVVVIIGILAAIATPKFTQVSKSAKEAEAGPILKQVMTLEERYLAKTGSYTTDIALLEGGSAIGSGGKYYAFSVVADDSGFCAVASPTTLGTAAALSPRSLDADNIFYTTSSCS